jgi:hypothetical protein
MWGFWVGCTNIDIKTLKENLSFFYWKDWSKHIKLRLLLISPISHIKQVNFNMSKLTIGQAAHVFFTNDSLNQWISNCYFLNLSC